MNIKPKFRSALESETAKQLDEAGIDWSYETEKVAYEIPARTASYTPDFVIPGTNIVLEGKGHFGMGAVFKGRFVAMQANSAQARQKFALLKEQHPDLDIRFIFSNARAPIYKGSPTSHGAWALTHGFKFCQKTIPDSWLKEIRTQQRKRKKA